MARSSDVDPLCALIAHLMSNEIISYNEMCQREGLSLQRGMNFSSNGRPSIILMSQRSNAPYDDVILDDERRCQQHVVAKTSINGASHRIAH